MGILLFIAMNGFINVWADTGCEQKMRATQMMSASNDAAIICKQSPNAAAQQCIVNILTRAKGKLHNKDLFSVVAYCKVDPRIEMQSCLLKGLVKNYNDPGYVGAKHAGDACIQSLPRLTSKKKGN